uniref:Flavin-containing monooxygenase n=1 Tax=Panagrolaimus davidi TaxID=227884 RepID=A0A914QXS4_9BILA
MISRKPDRVAIIGAGVSGIAAASLYMSKQNLNIRFYYKTGAHFRSRFGGGAKRNSAKKWERKQAIAYGFDPIIFEKSPNLGGIWNYSDDPDVRSVSFSTTSLTSKELMAFSEFPPPEKFGIFMHHTEILEYLNLYVDNFKLRHLIKFSTEVIAVNRADDWKDSGHWIVTTKDG